jgi:hypothetical protein
MARSKSSGAAPGLTTYEKMLLLYGSFAFLEDLFSMQAHGSFRPSSKDFDSAVLANQAMTLIAREALAGGSPEARDLVATLRHSKISAIAELARSVGR